MSTLRHRTPHKISSHPTKIKARSCPEQVQNLMQMRETPMKSLKTSRMFENAIRRARRLAERGGRFASIGTISCSKIEPMVSKRPRDPDPDFEPKRKCVGMPAQYSLAGSTSPFSNSSVVNVSSESMLFSPEESSAQMTFRFDETIAGIRASTCSAMRQERHVLTRDYRIKNLPAIGFLSEHDASNYLMRSLAASASSLYTPPPTRDGKLFCPTKLHYAVSAEELRAQPSTSEMLPPLPPIILPWSLPAASLPAAGLAGLLCFSWPCRPSAVL